jgi:ubiquinone/menaquinone biosynthesis C-methylase UbiE
MNDFWNERYASKDYVYGKEPNQYFKEQLKKLPPGKILLPAEGEGRQAIFAAKNEWNVTAFDLSTKGKDKADKLAKVNNVNINYIIASFQNIEFDNNSFVQNPD